MFLDVRAMLRPLVQCGRAMPFHPRCRKRTRQVASLAEPLEGRLLLAADIYLVPGNATDQVDVSFLLTQQQTKQKNEVGVYVVDDASGSVDGQQPGTAEYARAVLHSPDRHILFPSGGQAGASEEITLPGGTRLAFYLVKNRGSQDLLDRDHRTKFPKSPEIYFSADDLSPDQFDHAHSQVLSNGDGQYMWKDKKKDKDREFDDAVYTVSASIIVDVEFFSDLAAFQAAADSPVVETFETFAPTGTNIFSPITLGDITITSFAGNPDPSLFIFPASFGNGDEFGVTLSSNVLTSSGTEDFEIAFASPPTAIGFDSITNFSTTKPVVSVYDTHGLLIGTYSLTQAADTLGFVGIASNVPIGKIRWTAADGEVENTGIDNIRIGRSNP